MEKHRIVDKIMKVVLCSPGLTYQADAPHSTRQRANAMASQGIEVTVVGFPPTYPADPASCHFNYVSVIESLPSKRKQRWLRWKQKLGPYWTHAIEPFLVKRAAFRHARQTSADVLYVAHTEPWIFLILSWFNHVSQRRIPTFAMIAQNYQMMSGSSWSAKIRGWLNQTAVWWLPRYCDIICDNTHVAKLLGVDQHPRTHIISEGRQELFDTLSQAESRKVLGIPVDKRMLLLFGVAIRSKGADILFNAMDGLEPKFMVYVVGQTGGVYDASWGDTEKLMENGWRSDLKIIPRFVSEEEMEQLYSACDGIVIPYRKGFATTTGGLMKAIEYGKAIIASDQYYMGEIVREHQLGLLFPPEDVEALRRCLSEFAEKPESWFEEIRCNSRRVVQEKGWTKVGGQYRELFEEMVASKTNQNLASKKSFES